MESNQVTIDLATKPLSEIHNEVQQVAGPQVAAQVAAQVTLCTAILRASEAISAGQTKGETQ